MAWQSPLQSASASLLLLALLVTPMLSVRNARADASLDLCQRWRRSSGTASILLGNAIGAAAYLTKVRRFAESSEQKPELLYAPADLIRACDGWR